MMPERYACLRQPDSTVLRIRLRHSDMATGFGVLDRGTPLLQAFLRIDPKMERGGRCHKNVWDEVNGEKVLDNGSTPRWTDARMLLDLRQMLHVCEDGTKVLAVKLAVKLAETVQDITPAVWAKSDAFEVKSCGLVGLRSDLDRAAHDAPQFQRCPQLRDMKGLEAWCSILVATGLVQPRKTAHNAVPERLALLGFDKPMLYPKTQRPVPVPVPMAMALAVATDSPSRGNDDSTPFAFEGDIISACGNDYDPAVADSTLVLLAQGGDWLPASEDDMLEEVEEVEEEEEPEQEEVDEMDEEDEVVGEEVVDARHHLIDLPAVLQELQHQLHAKDAQLDEKDAMIEKQNALIQQLVAQLVHEMERSRHPHLAYEGGAASDPATPRTSLRLRAKRAIRKH